MAGIERQTDAVAGEIWLSKRGASSPARNARFMTWEGRSRRRDPKTLRDNNRHKYAHKKAISELKICRNS